MKINVLKKKSKTMRAFDKAEWRLHDHEHFGKDVVWDTNLYYLKAHLKKEILGTMELEIEGGVGYIKTLLVSHTRMKQGIGKELIEKAEAITRKQKGHKMFLTTGKNWDAVKFYKAIGFEITGKLNNHYFNIDFVEMSKFLK